MKAIISVGVVILFFCSVYCVGNNLGNLEKESMRELIKQQYKLIETLKVGGALMKLEIKHLKYVNIKLDSIRCGFCNMPIPAKEFDLSTSEDFTEFWVHCPFCEKVIINQEAMEHLL